MANIRLDLNTPVYNGQHVTFRSPTDCSKVTGLKVYYPKDNTTASKTFQFADAHGNNVGSIDLFAANVLVKVILDTESSRAFVQNPDTNKYLEDKFKSLEDDLSGLSPEYTVSSTLVELTSGEKLSVAFGKTAKAVSDLISHLNNKSNPHGVTKSQIGLSNVPNVTTNDQTPTFTAASTLAGLTSGEKLSVAFGKIAKAVSDLISHISNKSNPHGVTVTQVGAVPTSRKVNNKPLSADISLTASDVGAVTIFTGNKKPSNTGCSTLLEYLKQIRNSNIFCARMIASTFPDLPTSDWAYSIKVDNLGGDFIVTATKLLSSSDAIYVRGTTASGEWYQDWKKLSTTDYALPRDGSVPMTGNLFVNNGHCGIEGTSNHSVFWSKPNAGDTVGSKNIAIYNSLDSAGALKFEFREIGSSSVSQRTILHTGNKSLITPADIGAAKVVTGTYTGNNTSGSSNKNSIPLTGDPKLIVINTEYTNSVQTINVTAVWNKGSSYFPVWSTGQETGIDGLTGYVNNVTSTSGSFSWYGTCVKGQLNENVPYNYTIVY